MELLRKLLFPISLIYALVVHVRNYLYDLGVFESRTFKTPSICIGNLSVGGTGKTPMAEFLISLFKHKYTLALLSRGYGRESEGFILANVNSTVGDLGDEPYQIYRKFPEIAVAVDANRRNGIRILQEKVCPDLILLDDAFQHRKVKYGISILLTAYNNLYVDDWYLPTGNLRDSKREAKRADVIIVTKCPSTLSVQEQQRILQKLRPESYQPVIFSCLAYGPELLGAGNSVPLDYFRNKKTTLATGIADSKPLIHYLDEAGLVFDHLCFKDHHSFTENELTRLRKKEVLITTEKDYVRLNWKVENVYYLPVKHHFLGNGKEVLEEYIEDFMKSDS